MTQDTRERGLELGFSIFRSLAVRDRKIEELAVSRVLFSLVATTQEGSYLSGTLVTKRL